jgi:hypothetical protein
MADKHAISLKRKIEHKCEHCEATYSRQSDLVNHINTEHTTIDSFKSKCPYCELTYNTMEDMLNHFRSKHHLSDEPAAKKPRLDSSSIVDVPLIEEVEILAQGKPMPVVPVASPFQATQSAHKMTRVTVSPQISGALPRPFQLPSPVTSTSTPPTPAASTSIHPTQLEAKPKFTCGECYHTYKSEMVYLHHIRLHAECKLMFCEGCKTLFNDYNKFSTHKH